jgi:hypothetical protein
MARHPARVAAILSALVVIIVVVVLAVDRDLADRVTHENGAVEWLQAALFAMAAFIAVRTAHHRWRAGASPVFEVLVTAMLAGLVIGEIDLDRLIFGRKIIYTRFLVDTRVWLGWRALALLVMTLPPVVLALYALRRRRDLVAAIRRALVEPAGRVFIAGAIIFGLTEVLEKPLGRVPGLPRYMAEEVLELVAGLCFAVGLYARWRLLRVEEKVRPGVEGRCTRPR